MVKKMSKEEENVLITFTVLNVLVKDFNQLDKFVGELKSLLEKYAVSDNYDFEYKTEC